jgi:dihydrofolate reductase
MQNKQDGAGIRVAQRLKDRRGAAKNSIPALHAAREARFPPGMMSQEYATIAAGDRGSARNQFPEGKKMKASVFIATSLDGFIARPDGSLDWLPGDDVEPHGYEEFIATIDALVIGRKTFDTVAGFPSWPYGTTPVIVLSSTLTDVSVPEGAVCEVMTGTPDEVVSRLAARGMNHLYIDGGITIQGFLEAGLIQRLTITRIPVLLGSGIPLFGALSHDIRCQHVATRFFPSGLVQSEYVIPDSTTKSQ